MLPPDEAWLDVVSEEDTSPFGANLEAFVAFSLGLFQYRTFAAERNGKTTETLPEPVFPGDFGTIHPLTEVPGHRVVLCRQRPHLVR